MCLRLRLGLIFILLEWFLTLELSSGFLTGYYGGYSFNVSSHFTESWNKNDAQNLCRRNGTTLVEITNSDVQNAMTSFLNSVELGSIYYARAIFTGGIRTNFPSWRRLNGSDTGSMNISGQSNVTYSYAYLTKSTGYTITAAHYNDLLNGYVCEGETNCRSTNGLVIDTWCYKAYAYGPSWFSWFDARTKCINRGGDLASFYPITNNSQLNRLDGLWLLSSSSYWIGFRYESWSWDISKSDMKYTNWAFGQPVKYPNDPNDCMCVIPNQWKWQACRCTDSTILICYSGTTASTSTTTTPTTTSTATITTTTATATTTATKSAAAAASHTVPNAIVIAVGLGVGLPLLLIIVVLAAVILYQRRNQAPTNEEKPYETYQIRETEGRPQETVYQQLQL